MKKNIYKIIALSSISLTLFFVSCSEDVTPSLYDLSSQSVAAPVITSISPANQGLAGDYSAYY